MTAAPDALAAQPPDPVLLVSADIALVHEVERIAVAAGVALEVASDPPDAALGWDAHAAVLVGADRARSTAELLAAVPRGRREDVYVVAAGAADDACFRWAVGLGATAVLELPAAVDWLVATLSDLETKVACETLAVIGGSGGAGASCLAVALGDRAARRGATTLIDLDPDGPGASRLLGSDVTDGLTWSDLSEAHGRLGARALRAALPAAGELRVLGWSHNTDAETLQPRALPVHDVLAAARRGSSWVVLDLPRAAAPFAGLAGQVDQVVVVVRPTVAGVASAMRTVERAAELGAPMGLVVRAGRGSPLSREVATALRLPVLAELPHHRRLDEHLDLGLGPCHDRRSPLAAAAETLLRRRESRS